MFCSACGKDNKESNDFCKYCGARLNAVNEKSSAVTFSVSEKGKWKGDFLVVGGVLIIIVACVLWIASARVIGEAFTNLINECWQDENYLSIPVIVFSIIIIVTGRDIKNRGHRMEKRNICVARDKIYCNFFRKYDDATIEIKYNEIINVSYQDGDILIKTVRRDFLFSDIENAENCVVLIRNKMI